MTISVQWVFNRTMNGFANVCDTLVHKEIIVPTALGAIGGYLASVGPQLGAFQGLTAGATYSWVIKPLGNYISRNRGEGADQIHDNAVIWLGVAGVVVEMALPIFLTMQCGKAAMDGLNEQLPSSLQYLAVQEGVAAYTLFRGVLVNVLSAITQWWITDLREQDPRKRRIG